MLHERTPQGRRVAPPLTAYYVRDLTPEDLQRVGQDVGAETPALMRIKHRHHSLARALAEGLTCTEAAAVTGYAISRVSILQNDPAFAELVANYTSQVREKFLDAQQKRAELHETVIDELQARIDEKPEAFANAELRELFKATDNRLSAAAASAMPRPGLSVQISFTEPPPREMIEVNPRK